MRARVAVLWLLSVSVSACGSGSGSSGSASGTAAGSQQPVPPDASPPADASAPTATSSAPSSSSDTAAPALTGFAALQARYPDEAPWTTGPGTVCGSATCKKGELCCLQGENSRACQKGARQSV